MYGTGLILGAGIYVLIGEAAGIAGNAMWISFIIAAIIASFTGLSYAELTSVFPKTAAEYVFTKNASKNSFLAFIIGCLIVFVALVFAATVAVGFSGYVFSFLSSYLDIPAIVYAVALVGFLSFANFYGITESMRMNVAFTLIELSGLVIIIVAGFAFASPAEINYLEIPEGNNRGGSSGDGNGGSGAEGIVEPLLSSPLLIAVISAAGLVFFSYTGFENMANIAEETKNPSKVLPRALLLAILITTITYIVVAISSLALTDGWSKLSASDAPLATAAESAFGMSGSFLLGAIALFATSNTVLMMMISGSRIIFGIAKDGSFPAFFGKVHERRRTPWVAVITVMIGTLVTIILASQDIAALANVSVFGIFIVYAAVNLSLIVLRYRQPDMPRPFRTPISIGKFPVLAGFGLATSIAMLFQFPPSIAIAGLSVVGASMALYLGLRKSAGSQASR